MGRNRVNIPPPPVALDTVEAIRKVFTEKLYNHLGRFPEVATDNDRYLALAFTVRDRLHRRGMATGETYYRQRCRTACYLSAEYLPGPHLARNLLNLGLLDEARQAMADLGLSFDGIAKQEEEPGLGNGGLGRLAACFMESMATLQIPAIGYGIRYEFGIFDQAIRDGWQVELTDKWLGKGNPWEIARPEIQHEVPIEGYTEMFTDGNGNHRVRWVPAHVVKGVAYDTYIPGHLVNTANLLRLWKAEAAESFDFEAFNVGDYWRAVEDKIDSENITKILYPNDEPMRGKRLRLEQQFFFVSCSLQDMIRIFLQTGSDLGGFSGKYAVQLNDTHPAVAVANPALAALLDNVLGPGCVSDLARLEGLEPLAPDPSFQEEWRAVKRAGKEALAGEILRRTGIVVDPDALFDVHVKRIHEYKRQHLNILHVVALHQRLRRDPGDQAPPRVVIFSGRAAPGYRMAKLIIKLIHSVAERVNADPETKDRLKVVFLPDYNVKNAMPIFPAADLSQQISTAGMEASGTGNMKLALNGALTIGTLDGANVEIREAVRPENFFLFGLTAGEVEDLRGSGYRPRDHYQSDPMLREAVDLIASGEYSAGDNALFLPLTGSLLENDPFLVLEDFADYIRCQADVERAFNDRPGWSRKSILNVARIAPFSSDRAIAQYCRDIWKVEPETVQVEGKSRAKGQGLRV
ncbi:MAG: glycogen/starch/alpha-glucan phosphorylase [bacterium]|nr:glycogen/starch/alpha-glucan phosphorylase [bacterium]